MRGREKRNEYGQSHKREITYPFPSTSTCSFHERDRKRDRVRQRERERGREKERQTDRQTDRQTERERERETRQSVSSAEYPL